MSPSTHPSTRGSLRKWFTRTAATADDLADSTIRHLRQRWGRSVTPQIQAYTGIATADAIHLSGRVLANPPVQPDFKNDRWWQNFRHSWRRFASDEIPGVKVEGSFQNSSGRTVTDAEGYLRLELPIPKALGEPEFWSSAHLAIVEDTRVTPLESLTTCDVLQAPRQAKYAIVSDIDDTILRTGATDLATMAKLTFFGNARTRAPLEGVASLYECMQHDGNRFGPPVNPIFYVSSSPWNLFDLLEDFLHNNAIPQGPLFLRDLGIDRDKFIKQGHDRKLEQTRFLMNAFPELPFVLVGDSGQEDARLYATAAEEFGDRILAIFIRDIDPTATSAHDQKVDRFARRSLAAGVPMHLVKDSIEVSVIAERLGLLTKDSLFDIAEATKRDQQRQAGSL
ncbi:MAG: App1 family protein [Rhodopirellula sp. JB055]|uniref:App1 family protein n=1 Tax=Rhodopirellula sp. JB055 TaxID=3342846 RepID=UPI00370A8372